jgi:hypothetical protein
MLSTTRNSFSSGQGQCVCDLDGKDFHGEVPELWMRDYRQPAAHPRSHELAVYIVRWGIAPREQNLVIYATLQPARK